MSDVAPNARIACSTCGRPCRSHLTRICRTCFLKLPHSQRPNLKGGQSWAYQTGTNHTVNATPPDDLQNSTEVIRPGSHFGNTPEEIASVKQHIDERATDPADHAELTQTIFGRSK